MSKALLIVESPAKAKTIKKYVGSNYDVLASKGHIKDLPKKGGVDMEHGFEESYELLEEKGKAEIIKAIRTSAKKVGKVLLATDPDREGEAIAFHLRDIVREVNPDVEIQRVLFNEITKKGVLAGLDDPRELDANLYEAQRTRRVLDRIGGYPLSSLLWKKLTFGLSAGRVQTPALRIIVDREREREAFVPQNYWLVDAQLVGKSGVAFQANLVEVDGEKLERVGSRPAATSEPAAARYVSDLRSASYRIREITRRQSSRKAPAPYITSKLQQDASTRLGMAPKRAMSVAQQLYEGVELGKGKDAELVGLITYMRTDSTRVSDDAITACREYISSTFGADAVPPKPNEFTAKKKANVQDAHEAIRPTSMDHPPDQVAKYLKEPQLKLYRMIWNRFVASQMVPAVYDQTSVDIEAKGGKSVYGLRAAGSVLKKAGWREVWLSSADKDGEAADAAEAAEPEAGAEDGTAVAESGTLPILDDGETLKLVDPPGAQFTHKATEPPPRFNEASMVKKLEEEGIGRPSTYAEIISKVQARDYVEKHGNQLRPSDLGRLVIEKLVEDGFDLADIGFTRKLEESLDAVAEASAKRLDVLAPFHARLQAQIAKASESKGKWWPEPFPIGETCPDDGGRLMQRWGRNGVFIGCENYPECKHTRNIPKEGEEDQSREPELTNYDCTECGAKMMKRWGRNGFFLGCSNYPSCKATRPVPLGFTCPKCKVGDIIEIRSKGGKTFYGCTNYNSDEKCDFRSWQKPIGVPCEQCDSQFLVWMGGKKSPTLKCVNPTCDFETPFDPEGYEAEQDAARAAAREERRAMAEAASDDDDGDDAPRAAKPAAGKAAAPKATASKAGAGKATAAKTPAKKKTGS